MINFIFMLTHNDSTVPDASRSTRSCAARRCSYVGFKDIGATPRSSPSVAEQAHDDGLEVMLEVVSTSPRRRSASLEAAASIGVDWVLGGTNPDTGLRSSPAAVSSTARSRAHRRSPERPCGQDRGDRRDRPLTSTAGVDGVDLLAYRSRPPTSHRWSKRWSPPPRARSSSPARSSTPSRSRCSPAPGCGASPSAARSSRTSCPAGLVVAGQIRAVLDVSATVAG